MKIFIALFIGSFALLNIGCSSSGSGITTTDASTKILGQDSDDTITAIQTKIKNHAQLPKVGDSKVYHKERDFSTKVNKTLPCYYSSDLEATVSQIDDKSVELSTKVTSQPLPGNDSKCAANIDESKTVTMKTEDLGNNFYKTIKQRLDIKGLVGSNHAPGLKTIGIASDKEEDFCSNEPCTKKLRVETVEVVQTTVTGRVINTKTKFALDSLFIGLVSTETTVDGQKRTDDYLVDWNLH